MNIAANIAKFRKDQGMTQEALAEVIGVSAQTISKWETAATWPDAALLPVIADVDAAIEAVQKTIVAVTHVPEMDGSFEEHVAKYQKVMSQDKRHRSVIENDRDVLYYREAVGALALRKPEEGWSSLFGQAENLDILRLLADEDFRRAMQIIISRRMLNFTLPSLAKAAEVQDVQRLETMLQISGLFARRELMIDEKPLVFYELTMGETKLYLLYAVLVFAQELRTYESIHYCFFGNSNYFTP